MSTPAPDEAGGSAAAPRPGGLDTDRVLAVEEYRVLVLAAERKLDDVDRALAALAEGTYGTCEVCGTALAVEALEADPLVMRCPQHPAATP